MSASSHGVAATQSTTPRPWLKHYPKNVTWDQTFKAEPLYELLHNVARKSGNLTCTNFLGKKLTYREIADEAEKVAAGLQKIGVQKGTKVGLFLPNCPTFIIYYYAILKTGGIVVNYNPLYTLEELTYQVKDSDTEVMVTLDLKLLFDKVEGLLDSGVLNKAVVCAFPALLPGAKSVLFKLLKGKELARPAASSQRSKIVLESELMAGKPTRTPVPIDPYKDIAVLQYTGGTTGTPKGAMLTHANCYINVLQVMAWAPDLVYGRERMMGVLPFFHVFAMTVVMNVGIAKAAEIVIMPRFVLNDALKLINKVKPTLMPGVPTLFNAMINHPKIKTFDLSSLRFCLSGGAPLPLEVKRGFEAISGAKLVEGYGLSETSPVATANPLDGPIKDRSIGLPLPATIVSLRSLEDLTKDVPHGEKGEICISGPQVMVGYWNKPDETSNQFTPDNYLRTGDVARCDDDGFFYIEDRIKDLIICSGYNVYPRRVEDAIYTHAAVEEVTVIGIADPYRGEAPKAFVKLREGQSLTSEQLLQHLQSKLSKIELPAQIEFRDQLPKTMIGKLSKKELKAEEAERHGGA